MVGKIECRTSPEINASIYYDGRKQTNPTPIRLTGVPAGSHTIKFELDGYVSQTKTVNVSDDTTSYSTVTMKSTAPPVEEKGKIRCVTTPSGADVYFNGRKQVNITPVTLTGITPNKFHTIKFTKSDFLDASDQWLVKPGQTIVAEKILIPVTQPGYINAISDLPGVTVKMIIEGKTYSYPAPHKFGAPAGRNVVFFSKPNHKQVEHSITVEPRQTVTLTGNPIPIVADTVLILNTLPSEVSEGDKITLTGTLTSKDGKPIIGQIHFYDKDTLSADDELFENNKPLVAMSSSSTGKYSATWTAKKVDSESLIERGTSGAQIYAAFDGTQTHNKSESTIRNITLKEIAKEGQLRITTRPPGADVYIDGEKQEIGTSAEEFSVIKKLPFGKYTVKTEIKGFDPIEEEVEIKEGPYETIVNHIYEGAKNLCGVLGLETTELGCVRAILTLPIDLFSPLADAYVIKEHKSMYTGEPEEPTNMTYAFFLLGCIPVAGPLGKIISKAGFKITAKGAKLAQLAKADPRITSIFMEENIIGKILSMTATEVNKFIDLVVGKNYDGIRAMLKDTKAEALPADKIDEIIGNAKTIIPTDKLDDVAKHLDEATKIAATTSSEIISKIINRELTEVSDDTFNALLQIGMKSPDEIADALSKFDLKDLTYKLAAMDSFNATLLSDYFFILSRTKNIFREPEIATAISKNIATAIDKAWLVKKPGIADDVYNALFTSEDLIKPFDEILGSDYFKDVLDLTTSFNTSAVSMWRSATANYLRTKWLKISTFVKKNPKQSMVGGMALWFVLDNVPFYIYIYLKSKGLDPGTPSWRAHEFTTTLKDINWVSKDACETKRFDELETSIENFETTLANFESYMADNKDQLVKEGSFEMLQSSLELYKLALEIAIECLPAEVEIPTTGIIENVFVKKIIDGDTIECSTEEFPSFIVRTAGINTPEKKPIGLDFNPVSCTESSGAEPHTIECTQEMWYNANGQFWKLVDDKVVTLRIRPDRPKDAYGRYIAAIIASNGIEINIEMLKSGNACYYHRADFGSTEGDIIDHDAYIAARNGAKTAGLGIWASEELESDIGSAIFKAFRLTEEDKPIGLTAEIWLGDDFLYNSSTTKERDWSVGPHEVIFKAMGYVDNPVKFTIEKNKPIVVDATLVPTKAIVDEGYAILRTYRMSTTGSLVAITSDIYEDGTYLFRTSASTLRAFSPGKHTVVFKNINYEDKSSTFTIETDKTITVNETLVELPEDETEDPDEPDEPFGLVDFMSTPSVAKIFVNGSYIGTTKKSGFKLAEGSYSAMFEKEGYEPCTKPLTVIADERFPVECILLESLLPPTEGEYPDLPYFPSTPSRRRLPPSTYEITPIPTLPPVAPEPEAEPWEEFEVPMKVLFLNIRKEVTKQTTITTAGQKFIDKHCELEFEWESEDHDAVELGVDDNDCATLDDTEELTETIEPDKVPEGTKIIYLLWDADEPKCVSYTGFTSGMDDLLFDAMLCSSPTSKSKPEFTATTGKLKNDNLKIKYEGSLTIIIQICEALHELYEKTKSDDAEELPEFDDEFCKKDITDDRPNAKCVVEWLSKFNDALPDEVKK